MKLAESVINKLRSTHQVLCTIESCTGGRIAETLTQVPGSSQVFWGTWVVYDNSAKEELGISSDLIKEHGAVSPEVAKQLAELGLKKMKHRVQNSEVSTFSKDSQWISVATTGVAGPSGGSAQKPVGLCYIGVASSRGQTEVHEIRINPHLDRVQIQNQFVTIALELIVKQ